VQDHRNASVLQPQLDSSSSMLADRLLSALLDWMYHTLQVTQEMLTKRCVAWRAGRHAVCIDAQAARQVPAPLASADCACQPYQQQYPHHATQHLAPHSQAAAPASHQAHQYPAHIQGLANAHGSHTQNLQGFHHAAAHAQQQMHLQQQPGHVQHYGAGQYPPASAPMPDNTQAEAQGGASEEAAVRQDSIEPGDDWIEQVLPYGRLPAGYTPSCLASFNRGRALKLCNSGT